jgi:hypothetical protein
LCSELRSSIPSSATAAANPTLVDIVPVRLATAREIERL